MTEGRRRIRDEGEAGDGREIGVTEVMSTTAGKGLHVRGNREGLRDERLADNGTEG